MYYAPRGYSYPYYANSNQPMYYSDYMPRHYEENGKSVAAAILDGIKKEASAVDLYSRLVTIAPNQTHKSDIQNTLEGKKAHITQFTQLFIAITGNQPVYQINKVSFQNYKEGLQKAYELEVEGYNQYQRSSLLTQNPQIQNVFLWALNGEKDNALRLQSMHDELLQRVTDYGPNPFVVDIEEATKQNNTFRTALWTGNHLQLTLMSINVGEDIGLEIHPDLDQFLRIEEGQGIIKMGDNKDNLTFEEEVFDDFAIIIPAGKWHNLINTGNKPLKLYSIYAPPEHPYGTVHETKAIAMAAEEDHHH
ncbi:cupin [Alkalihalophilus pseudofirmus]|nr:cupin [Alkalihalophilus pseudofirmus]